MRNKNEILLSKIIQYCNEIEDTKKYFGTDAKTFLNNSIYRNSCNMCILQIGELIANLDDNIKAKYPKMPWKEIKGMRNVFAHNYHNVDFKDAWKTIVNDIPILKKEITEILEKETSKVQDNKRDKEVIQENDKNKSR